MIRMVIILFLFMGVSCGIETGNPNGIDPTDVTSGTNEQFSTESYSVMSEICSKLVSCYSSSLTTSVCLTQVALQDNIETEIGLSDLIYNSFQEVIVAESNNEITANTSATTNCLTDISALSCADSEVTTAFDPLNPSDFSNVYRIIPSGVGSCEDIF